MKKNIFLCAVVIATLCSCSRVTAPNGIFEKEDMAIYPDYRDVTVPTNIAPLNFCLTDSSAAIAELKCGKLSFCYEAEDGNFRFDEEEWQELTARHEEISVTVWKTKKHKRDVFSISVSPDSIEPFVVYRRVVPGYHKWDKMGLYQRSLETFSERAIIENTNRENACVNCHTFNKGDASRMVFHQRAVNPGTFLVEDYGRTITQLNPELADGAQQGMVYPAWHPSGNYIAFSVNKTIQDMHLADSNRIEVFDTSSSIQIYDIRRNRLYTTPLLSDATKMNTFPTFSPDGSRLVYCSADTMPMPEHFREVRYNIVSTSFDGDNGSVGDTCIIVYDAASAKKSALLPRFSPDGSSLLFTEADYGTFPIWHHEADLRLLNMQSGSIDSLDIVNSNDTESFHTWSQTGRWMMFSSRREDGLFTRLYIAHVAADGRISKPFVLPQPDAMDNKRLMQSYNVPELVNGEIAPLE